MLTFSCIFLDCFSFVVSRFQMLMSIQNTDRKCFLPLHRRDLHHGYCFSICPQTFWFHVIPVDNIRIVTYTIWILYIKSCLYHKVFLVIRFQFHNYGSHLKFFDQLLNQSLLGYEREFWYHSSVYWYPVFQVPIFDMEGFFGPNESF